jgi:hypothetical protein
VTKLEDREITDTLHDAVLTAIAQMAPVGGRSLPINVVADALITLLAELLIATRPADLTAAEIEEEVARLTHLFRQRLGEAVGDRSSQPVGHA